MSGGMTRRSLMATGATVAALPTAAMAIGHSRLPTLWAKHDRLSQMMRGQPDEVIDDLADRQFRIEQAVIEAPCQNRADAAIKLRAVRERLGLNHRGLDEVVAFLEAN